MANIRPEHKRKKGSKKPTTKEARKREFVYRPLDNEEKDVPQSPAYEAFMSIRWDEAWKEFLLLESDGVYKYKTSWNFAKHYSNNDAIKKKAIYLAIGPKVAENKSHKEMGGVPYLGDWDLLRSSLFIGETKKQSMLFGNPRVQAIREIVKTHLDVMKISQGVAEILIEWLGRYQMWANQVDEEFNYKLFDSKKSDDENDRRFKRYTKMQRYILERTLDCTRQILRCYGVGADDVALLTQMMIAASRSQLGESTANMMLAASGGVKFAGVIDGGLAKELPTEEVETDPDKQGVKEVGDAFEGPKANPALKLMLGTFLQKATMFKMQHPDITIEGAIPDDNTIEPSAKANGKANGKTNGAAKSHLN